MAYSGVYVFGDSLVDAGNALKLAETYDYFPFTSLPDGAPTSDKGYYSGNFTNGWTFADLISNKYVSAATKSIFPFGYDEPFLGISFGFISDPKGNNLNFAYGGAQIRQGDEAVPDMDDQTDAYRDAVDGHADPNALHMFVFGANDVHDLVPKSGAWTDEVTAQAALQKAANEYIEEVLQTIDIGARHILLVGVPDIGVQPYYNGSTDEAARRATATEYAQSLDQMIQAQLGQLAIPGVEIHYVPFADLAGSVLGTMVDLHGMAEIYPLNLSDEVFFDKVHPTAQAHALAAAYMIDLLSGVPAGETIPLTAPDYSMSGLIGTKGEVDLVTVTLAANTSYTFQLLGLSTLGGDVTVLADPTLALFGPAGTLVGSNDDGGIGLDSSFTFTSGAAGTYTIHLTGLGVMTGTYQFQAAGQATGNNSYAVSNAGSVILEHAGGGFDTVKASVSYALNAGAEIEVLRTSNDRGKTAINLTGNEYGQTIVGNLANNVIEGKAGADVMTGGGGKDVFVLSNAAVTNPGSQNIDRITDYGVGDVVDISQVLKVAASTNIVGGGFLRVTTSGLVQVDVDGGGNNWATLSQINGTGAVNVRYLSGGLATNASVSRVPASSATLMAGSVAAAGLAAITDTSHSSHDATGERSLSNEGLVATVAAHPDFLSLTTAGHFDPGDQMTSILGEALPQASTIHEWIDANLESVARHPVATSDWAIDNPAFASGVTDNGIPAISLGAMTVAIPSAQMLRPDAGGIESAVGQASVEVAEILADTLQVMPGGPDASDLMQELAIQSASGQESDWRSTTFAHSEAAMAAMETNPIQPLVEHLSFHPDIFVVV